MKKNKFKTIAPLASVNIASAEFHNTLTFENLPGTIGTDYVYPKLEDLEYYANTGIKLVRIPIRWERLEVWKTSGKKIGLGSPVEFRNDDLNEIKRIISQAEKLGLYVLLDLHNHARYYFEKKEHILRLLSEDGIPAQALGDFWKSLINEVVIKENHDNVLYGIMNEPHDIISKNENRQEAGKEWKEIAEKVIYAIRNIDPESPIVVAGYQKSSAELWEDFNPNIKDLALIDDMIIFEAHCYFDKDSSGKYGEGGPTPGLWPYDAGDFEIGVRRVTPFVNWTLKHKLRGFIGEFGIPYPKTTDWPNGIHEDDYFKWREAMVNFMSYLEANGKPYCYWAGGSIWHDKNKKTDSFLSCHPTPKISSPMKPQLEILIEYVEQMEKMMMEY